MDNLVSIIKQPTVNHDVKQKVLRLVQNWAMAFEQKPTLSYVPTLYKSLKNEGESSALIATSRGRVCVSVVAVQPLTGRIGGCQVEIPS